MIVEHRKPPLRLRWVDGPKWVRKYAFACSKSERVADGPVTCRKSARYICTWLDTPQQFISIAKIYGQSLAAESQPGFAALQMEPFQIVRYLTVLLVCAVTVVAQI